MPSPDARQSSTGKLPPVQILLTSGDDDDDDDDDGDDGDYNDYDDAWPNIVNIR